MTDYMRFRIIAKHIVVNRFKLEIKLTFSSSRFKINCQLYSRIIIIISKANNLKTKCKIKLLFWHPYFTPMN